MGSDVKTWRYSLPSVDCEGWAIVLMDSKGFFASVSDYGNYAYLWTAHGKKDFREFILEAERDPGYFEGKFSGGRRDYDPEATERAVREHVLEMRKARHWSAELAREEWDHAEELENSFERWMDGTGVADPWFFRRERMPRDVQGFARKILPRLAKAIREELEAESL